MIKATYKTKKDAPAQTGYFKDLMDYNRVAFNRDYTLIATERIIPSGYKLVKDDGSCVKYPTYESALLDAQRYLMDSNAVSIQEVYHAGVHDYKGRPLYLYVTGWDFMDTVGWVEIQELP